MLGAAPGVERHVLDLVDRIEGVGIDAPDRRSLGGAGPLLDGVARAAYRHQIEVRRRRIDDALEAESYDRADSYQSDLDTLVTQPAGAFGNARQAGSAAGRARLNATRSIRTATKRLDAALPGAGAALDRRVHTGRQCVYAPEPSDTISWIVQS